MPRYPGLPYVVLAAVTWGTIGIAVDLLYRVDSTDPLSVGFWRLALSAPVLLVLSRLYAGPGFWRVERRDAPALLLMGAAFALYQVGYFAAIPRIGVAAAVLVNICSAPLFVAVLSGVFLGEKLTPVIGAALLGAVTGAALLVSGSPQAASTGDLLAGVGLALGAGLAYSLVAITGRAVAPRYHPVQPVALAFSLSTTLLLPVALVRGLDLDYPAAGWGLLLYLGLVPTALGYGLYLRGLRTTTATVSAIVALLEPLISTLLAVTVLGERLSAQGALGAALLLGSVAYLYLRSHAASHATNGRSSPSPGGRGTG
jgi:DME family drug/metabolite transporter